MRAVRCRAQVFFPSRITIIRGGVAAAVVAGCLVAVPAAVASAPNPEQAPLRATQVLAPGWTNANKELGRVDAILRVGKRVFVGGNFTVVGGHAGGVTTRMHLMAVRAGTGRLTSFAPQINGRVYALALSPGGRFLYAGGQFTAVGTHPRDNLAAFDLTTGRLSSRLPNLAISGAVRGLAVSRMGRIYVAGAFGRVSGVRRANLAKLVLERGRYVLNRRWHPSTNQDVRRVVVSAATSRVIIGGDFTTVNGLRGQNHIAALGQGRGKVLPWANHPRSPILDLALCGRSLYAAEGGPGGTALAYGLAGRRKWYYMTDGNVQAVACVSHRPAFGMHGDYVAPRKDQNLNEHGSSRRIQRHKLFILTAQGNLMRWNPDCSSTAGVLGVWSLEGYKGNLYVGGDFTGVHGVPQQRFAILRRS
jgi:hypothetical protein